MEINPILHDESFVSYFGIAPDATTNEQLRIQAHLYYVETLLRNSSATHLTATQQKNRLSILNLLHHYADAGIFPTNKDYPGERKPCFIDAEGNICAVGYLIEQTKGRTVAEEINKTHQYDYLLNMNEAVIENWANEYGLTLNECAMIQPTYGGIPNYPVTNAEIKTGYGISSGVAIGGNVAVNIFNLSKGKSSKTLACIGLFTGTTQLVLGITNIKKPETIYQVNGGEKTTVYRKQNNLSYANIALGTTTIITSAINLAVEKKNKDNKNAFNLYGFPNEFNSLSMGLCLTRKL